MNILILGSGAREHAIVWKLRQSKSVSKIFAIPGNSGISQLAECCDGNILDFDFLNEFVDAKKIDLIFPGPEVPIVAGLVDYFADKKVLVFGPDKHAAQLEGSKSFAKNILKKHKIPTASFENFSSRDKAIDFISRQTKFPIVIKASGLAQGKGVIIAANQDEAKSAVDDIMLNKVFGESGREIVIEEFLEGFELSLHVIMNENSYKILPFSQDHKQVFDDDKGPNTGGMGAFAPCPLASHDLQNKITSKILEPLFAAFKYENINYRGVLYIGLMICDGEPFVLEFNVRFGDPETQVLLPLLDFDFLDLILASLSGNLDKTGFALKNKFAIGITCAAKGYPGDYEKGKTIRGLESIKDAENDEILVFQAGVKINEKNETITNGGRVLTFTALGNTLKDAGENAYENIKKIGFENMHFRRDIGKRKELEKFCK